MSQSTAGRTPFERVDALIVTATPHEYEAVLEVDTGAAPGSSWERRMGLSGLEIAVRAFEAVGGGALRVAVGRILLKEGRAPVHVAAPLIRAHSPRCLAVSGVCAGREGAVAPGDVIIAERLWGSEGALPYQLGASWRQAAAEFSPEAEGPWLSRGMPGPKRFKAHLGSLGMPGEQGGASAASASPHPVLGLELEASVLPAVGYRQDIPYLVVVKGVECLVSQVPGVALRHFASRASAECLLAFLRAQLPPVQLPADRVLGGDAGLDALLGPGAGEPAQGASLLPDVRAWCEEEAPVSVRLFHGASGAGKTRLFVEACRQLREQGWRAGFLEDSAEPDLFERLASAAVGRPTLVVIDAADRHPRLGALLQSVAHRWRAGGKGRFRLALLARETGGWWEVLARRSLELRSLLRDRLPTEVAAETGKREGQEGGRLEPGGLNEATVLRTLRQEGTAAGAWLKRTFGGDDTRATRLGFELLGNLAVEAPEASGWIASLLEGAVASRAVAALEAAKSLAQGPAFAVLGKELTRALEREGTPGVAERLELAGLPEHQGALREVTVWAKSTLVRSLSGGEQTELRVERARLRNSLGFVLKALDRREEALASAQEAAALYSKLAEEYPETFSFDCALSLGNLGDVQGAVDRREEALASARAAVERYRVLSELQPKKFRSFLGRGLDALAQRQSALGQREQALATMQETVGLYGKLVAEDPEAYLPELAATLNNLSHMQLELGWIEPALGSMQEAAGHYRTLVKRHPEAYLSELAMSLANLGFVQRGIGRRQEALASIQEAVSLLRQRVDVDPEEVLPLLAASLNGLSTAQSAVGQGEEALASIQEALAIRRQLVEKHPEAHLPDLAKSLGTLGMLQGSLGRFEEALASSQEAVSLHRKLAEVYPEAFLADLATGVSNLGVLQGALGHKAAALASAQEAVGLYRKLSDLFPGAFHPQLAAGLGNLSNLLSEVGQWDEALGAAKECVALRRALAEVRPEAELPDLALSLNNLGVLQSRMGWKEEALASVEEAVEIRRKLAGQHPEVFLGDLATGLSNLGNLQRELGRGEEALVSLHEALDVLWPSFLKKPAAYARLTGSLLKEAVVRQQEVGSPPPATLKERLETWEKLTSKPG
jgi:tetratricopeptide (TPR) repeat protein